MEILDLVDASPTDDAPRSGADRGAVMVGAVTDVSQDGTRVSVSVLGSDPVSLPATASVWSGVSTAHVLMDAATGRPVHVLGPATAPVEPVRAQDPAQAGQALTLTRTAVVVPQWSGTWRQGQGWDQWNTGRYGGRTDLYQGSWGSSFQGLATYGATVTSLGATALTSAALTLTGNGSNRASWTAVVQAADWSAGGPTPSGPTVTVTVAGAATSTVDVTALAAELLRGRGLALVGGDYGAVGGTGASMSLALTYEVTQ